MPDDATGAETTDAAAEKNGNSAGESSKTFTQEQLDKIIAREKGQIERQYGDYNDLKAKAARFDEVAESQKTEAQKAQEKLAAESSARTAAETRALRYEVAAEKGLPLKWASRLTGSTKEELAADADELVKEIDPGADFEGGARETAPTTDMNSFIRAGARKSVTQ